LGHFTYFVHTGNLQFLAIFYKLSDDDYGSLSKTSKISINTLKKGSF